MLLAKRSGHLAIEADLNQRCAKFFEVARYVALEKTRVTGNPAGAHEYIGIGPPLVSMQGEAVCACWLAAHGTCFAKK